MLGMEGGPSSSNGYPTSPLCWKNGIFSWKMAFFDLLILLSLFFFYLLPRNQNDLFWGCHLTCVFCDRFLGFHVFFQRNQYFFVFFVIKFLVSFGGWTRLVFFRLKPKIPCFFGGVFCVFGFEAAKNTRRLKKKAPNTPKYVKTGSSTQNQK